MHLFPEIPNNTILGINYSGMHDSAVALVSESGEVLFACALERLTRVKQDGRPPSALLENLPWEKISAVAVSTEKDYTSENFLSRIHPVRLPVPRETGLVHGAEFHAFLDSLPAPKQYVCHHLSHAASAFWPSGFDDSLCLVYDGGMANCAWFGGLYRASQAGGIQPLDRFGASHHAKITTLYTSVTALLGFTPNKHEGKITGLAAFGKPTDRCRELLRQLFTEDYFALEEMTEWFFAYNRDIPPMLLVNGEKRERLLQRFSGIGREEMAATVQAMAEEHVLELLDNAAKQGWASERICLSGGLFANVKINQRIKEWGFKQIFVSPPMTDDGTALGAALHVASRNDCFKPQPHRHVYFGPKYSPAEIEEALNHWQLDFVKTQAPAEQLADALAKGAVIALFQSRMEFGPRALGNRSIISQAVDAEINCSLNARLLRTEFMPFAPITRIEDMVACYVGLEGAEHAAEFMTITCRCTDVMREKCPAVVHVDQTARPQLVGRESQPFLHEVLTRYLEKTGLPALINTSFNIHEEPIVCTPDDAIQGFLESGLDYLYLEGGYWVGFAANRERALSLLQRRRGDGGRKSGEFRDVTLELSRRLNAAYRREAEKEKELAGLKEKDEEILTKDGEINSLKKDCDTKDTEIDSLKGICEEREKIIFQLDERVRFLERTNPIGLILVKARAAILAVAALLKARLEKWARPRIGVLRQHPPRDLALPPPYLATRAQAPLPLISIVTPSFNQAVFLERTIQSVKNQDYANLEYVVQDGGSSDGTVEVLDRFSDFLTHWQSAKDNGQTHAINLGFAHAHGEIMAYLNSDDILLSGTLHYVADYFAKHPDVDVVYSHRVLIDENDQEIGRWILPPHDNEVLSWADFIPQETMFWRRRIWEKIGGSLDESFHFAMDWDLILRFREAGAKFTRLPRFLGAFRIHPQQKTSAEITESGFQEMNRLRERCHGRSVTDFEIRRAITPYLLRHVLYDKLYGLVGYSR